MGFINVYKSKETLSEFSKIILLITHNAWLKVKVFRILIEDFEANLESHPQNALLG